MRMSQYIPFVIFSALSLGAQILVFITNILIANKLSPVEYGMYSVIITVAYLLITLSCQWHTSMVHYCGSKEIAETGCMCQTNGVRVSLLFICYAITGVVLLIFYENINNYVGGSYVWIIFLLVIALGISDYFSAYLIARKKRQQSAIVMFILQLLVIIFLLIIKVSIIKILILQTISHLLFLVLIPFLHREDFQVVKLKSNFVKYSLSFALWQLVGSIAIYIISYGDIFIIKSFLSYSDVAHYNAAFKLFGSIFIASNIIASFYIVPLTKAIMTKNRKQIRTFFRNDRILIFLLCTFFHIVLIIFAKPIMSLLYQGKYDSSVGILQILLLASVIRYWTVFEMMYFNIIGQVRLQQTLNVLSAVIKVAFGIILVQYLGLIGLAISTLVATIITGVLSFVLSERKIANLYKE